MGGMTANSTALACCCLKWFSGLVSEGCGMLLNSTDFLPLRLDHIIIIISIMTFYLPIS